MKTAGSCCSIITHVVQSTKPAISLMHVEWKIYINRYILIGKKPFVCTRKVIRLSSELLLLQD